MNPRSFPAIALILMGCSASGSTGGFDGDGGPSADKGGDQGGNSAFSGDGGGARGAVGGKVLLYAHTDTTLFQLDPENLAMPLVQVGVFDCIGGAGAPAMTDLGVAKDGKLFGVSETAAYPLTVRGSTVHCDASWPLPANAKFYGLTMAPENTVDKAEVLIAANGAGELFRIDATTGTTTQVGTLGADSKGQAYALSGDIVFLANNGAPIGFATVRTCTRSKSGTTTCSPTDTLVEVNVSAIHPGTQSVLKGTRGPVNKGSWCTNASSPSAFGSMFGIAAFKDKVYGFSRKGDFIEINNADGSGCLVASYGSDKFAGAGVTTVVSVVAPPPVN